MGKSLRVDLGILIGLLVVGLVFVVIGTARGEDPPVVMAEESVVDPVVTPSNDLTGWTRIDGAAYQFQQNARGVFRLVVVSKQKLMTKKGEIWATAEEQNRYATDLAKDLRGKLRKIDQVAGVIIGYRMIIVDKFLLDDWQEGMPAILKALKPLEKKAKAEAKKEGS